MTWVERRSKWKFREAVMAKEKRNARVWEGNGRVMIEGNGGFGTRERRY